MRTIMADDLLHLLTWLSPAFPTGGFAYSHGLEYAVEARDVTDGAMLREWIGALLRYGAGRTDAILLRHAYRADDLPRIAAFAAACAPTRELAAETLNQGTAFVAAAKPWLPPDLAAVLAAIGPIAYPVAVGALAGATGTDQEATTIAYLHAWCATLVLAGVRLIPLGQSAGLAVQAALEPIIRAIAEQTRGAELDDIAACCIAADIGSMRHETQYTRLFRS
ncbi:urease accessory protein [Acidiphilium rubrum]|uniref:Urease accessory protein UreF n=2 Tax=Acidocellaceae TaxID=3385905 RepID=A0A8G2CMN6_ACIRU|nr:urease accessory protein [Acidiphilium rubrum]